jgi:PEGA domain-containing protein
MPFLISREVFLKTRGRIFSVLSLIAISAFLLPIVLAAGNKVMGEVEFQGKSKVEKTSGVWVDGQYVGYLKELNGEKKVLLLPGEHEISVRQNGYQDFTQRVTLRPGEKVVVSVAMQKAASGALPADWAVVKIAVDPSRAAVFLDGRFVGHVGEFKGMARSLQIAPGVHKIKIALPGYKTFETEINPLPKQKVEVKTQLVKSMTPVDDPSLKEINEDHGPPPPPEPAPPPPQR